MENIGQKHSIKIQVNIQTNGKNSDSVLYLSENAQKSCE